MDFILGSNDTEKTTCLLNLANQYIIDNKITKENGYIILFTPPINSDNSDGQNKNKYIFQQYFTAFCPQMKDNMDLIKFYPINNINQAFGLIDNFRIISREKKGLKLILIDELNNIIQPWVSSSLKIFDEAKENQDYSFLYYCEIFQRFLSKIILLQKAFSPCQCFISININLADHLSTLKYGQKIFNSIYPYIRNIYNLNYLQFDNSVSFDEIKLIINKKTDKINFEIIKDEENKEIYIEEIKNEFIKSKEKNFENKNYNSFSREKTRNWFKKNLEFFIYNINKFKAKKKEFERMKLYKEEENN